MLKIKYYVLLVISATIMMATSFSLAQEEKKILKEMQTHSEAKSLAIKGLKEKGDESAIRAAEEHLASNPNDIDIINLLTESYINRDDLARAESTVKKALAVNPSSSWSHRLLTQIYRLKAEKNPALKNDSLVSAFDQVNIGLGSNPNDISLLAEKAQIYLQLGDKDKANETTDLAISIDRGNAGLKELKRVINEPKESKE